MAEINNQLLKEFRFYLDHQDEMVAKYNGKVIVITNGEVLGAYDNQLTALTETQKLHKLGSFLVQKVSPGKDDYTQTFHARIETAKRAREAGKSMREGKSPIAIEPKLVWKTP